MDLKMIGRCPLSKFEYVKSLRVVPINHHTPDLVDQIRAFTSAEGVDVAYDAVGSEENTQRSYQAIKEDIGQVIVIGVMSKISTSGIRTTAKRTRPYNRDSAAVTLENEIMVCCCQLQGDTAAGLARRLPGNIEKGPERGAVANNCEAIQAQQRCKSP
ncbi:hypothetical protein F4813DRAFT_393466 [Daldinia decipiens]|uniref:uncharacterized protein n=1 Tax=Daldinia decipiens TaxID=326647 RepID=UPI0020C489FD|nr:uncharacterized protein F4813DRAFT_393466 [Daldinia decipiens]KAI1653702.1 hypothetical protein F4813DRAFT_393466 [Daldinia decipiens]